MKIYNRADIVNFLKIDSTFKRMQGFTEGGKSLNSNTYDRRYIDEKAERLDVTGYSTEIAYSFDRVVDNEIHELLANIHDKELVGQTVEIVTVNMQTAKTENNNTVYEARKRTFSVIPDSDGDNTDAYTYSGTFHASGGIVEGTATVSADGLTATFTPTESGE